jgi:asparagine synthase (glutamine-hydrolysing)
MVSQLARDNDIKAVLCGEGSDECYLGYSWLSRDILASIRRLPKRVARTLFGAKPILDASARDSALIGNLANNFERIVGPTTYDNEAGVTRTKAVSHGLAVDPELSYILRSLLLRNDAMGMAASVEARFPFLDSRLVKFSVNLPERCKSRFSPTATDRKHLFYQDKWIIRQMAARYLPPLLSNRPKGQFPTNAFQRMRIAPELFGDAFGAELLGVSGDRLTYFVRNASRSLQLRLMLLQSWWKICILNQTRDGVRSEIMKHTTVDPL